MARFRCRACLGEGELEYRPGSQTCPLCGAGDVQVALSVVEIPDDDPLIEAMRRLAEEHDAE